MKELPFSKLIDIPPVWLAVFACMAWIQNVAWPTGLGGAARGFGTALVLLGLALIVLAGVQFRRHQTSIVPHMRANSLITSGLYAISRNPIYLADALILTGLCLRWEAAASLILVPVFIWTIQRRFILDEEDRLRAGFGEEFEAYARRTRRWL